MIKKPRLSFWQIWNMSFGFLGIQFGFALQNANVSRIFQTLGGDVDRLAVYWLAAPVTGLIIQPIVGHYSDKTWNRLGRRRPYFLAGALLASAALLFMPNSPALWVAVGMLWIMDGSINITMEPFRAFVGDMLSPEQRTQGFAMQSFFIGIGAVIASLLPYLFDNVFGVANTAAEGKIPPTVKYSFYIGGAIFLFSVLWTIFRTREYPPEKLKQFDESSRAGQLKARNTNIKNASELIPVFERNGLISMIAGLLISLVIHLKSFEKELYILGGGLMLFGVLMLLSAALSKNKQTKNGLVEIFTDMVNMPPTMKQLAVVQFFSWFALFAMWIYTTAAVTSHVYGTSDPTSPLYNEGANWVGVLFGVYNGFAALVAFLLPVIAKHTSRKWTHGISLAIGGAAFLSIVIIKNPLLMIAPMLGIGLAWASILTMPYAILTSALPSHKMGVYMGIFNFFIVIPQILAASILGFFMRQFFNGQAIYALVAAGISLFIASLTVVFVHDADFAVFKKPDKQKA